MDQVWKEGFPWAMSAASQIIRVGFGAITAELEGHLERLTGDILETTIDDIPRRLQHYVIGVPGPFRRFLCKVAWAVVSYRDHHH